MSDSIFGSLLNTLDKRTVGDVAQALGQPEQSVSRGLETSIAATMAGLASKAEDSGALRRILDTVSSVPGPISWSQIAGSVTDPNSSLMAMGKRIVPALFGNNEKTVTSAISRDSGLSSGAVSTLLTMAAPVVMSFISKQVRDGGMTMSGLGSMLQREVASIRSALPAGLSEVFWPATATTAAATASPVVAQAVQRESSFNWLPVLAIAALGLGLLWFLGHARRPSIEQVVPSTAVGTASRVVVPVPKTVCTLPANVNLPQGGAAARILTIIQNPDGTQAASTWVNMDQLSFDSGSSRLRPQSQAQLDNIAVVLKSCPAAHLDIAGYTDNRGAADANLRLSQNRAMAVVAELAAKGVSPQRLTAEGYGEEDAVADNSTEQGRAQNRRAAVRVVTVK
ncbi:MAG TPA: OmpA family protein [Candidatus Binataceae bacterium]